MRKETIICVREFEKYAKVDSPDGLHQSIYLRSKLYNIYSMVV